MIIRNTTNTGRGFSLIELLVALSILAVVAAIIVPRFLNVRTSAAAAATSAQAAEIQHMLDQWISLGGTVTPGATNTDTGTAFMNIITIPGATAARANGVQGTAKFVDSSGNFGSCTLSLSTISVSASATAPSADGAAANAAHSPNQWYSNGGVTFWIDGAGNTHYVKITTAAPYTVSL